MMTHVLDDARGQMREGHTSAQWELIAREKVMRTLLETGEFTADSLADLNIPVEYRRHIHGAATGYFSGAQPFMEEAGRRKSDRPSRKGGKNTVFVINARGRRELPRLLRDLQRELPTLIGSTGTALQGVGNAAAGGSGENLTEGRGQAADLKPQPVGATLGETDAGQVTEKNDQGRLSSPSSVAGVSPASSTDDQLLQTLCEEFEAEVVDESSRVYLEAFAGGAAVLFAKPRAERETLNDADEQVTRFWRALRDRPDDLAVAVEATPYGRGEWNNAEETAVDDVEAARRLLVRIEQSFGRTRTSWARPSLNPDFRARWQGHTWQNLPARLLAAVDRLKGVVLESGDAIDLIPRWDEPDTLIYCDPPYTGDHRVAQEHRYAVDDHGELWPRLVDALLSVEQAAVILSGYPCDEAERLRDWRSVALAARTNMPLRGRTGSAPETLWLSPNVTAAPNLLDALETAQTPERAA